MSGLIGNFRRMDNEDSEKNSESKRFMYSEYHPVKKILRVLFISLLAFLSAGVAVLFLVTALRLEHSPYYDFAMTLRGVAGSPVATDSSTSDVGGVRYMEVKSRNESEGYVYHGEKDALLMRIGFMPQNDVNLMKLVIKTGSTSVMNLQLFYGDHLVTVAAAHDGKVIFQDLWLKLEAGKDQEIIIKGEIGSDSRSGEIITVRVEKAEDIVLMGSFGEKFSAQAQFPIIGRHMAVIGDKIQF